MGWQDRPYYRDEAESGGNSYRFLFPRTPLAIILMAICLGVFLFQAFTGPAAGISPLVRWGGLIFKNNLAFYQPWRWITYQYLHGDGNHIFFNLITMYFFVPFLEQRWGWKNTLLFYTAGGIAAGIVGGIMSIFFGQDLFLIGASGSLLAVIGAIATLAPRMQILLIIIPMTMRTLAILYSILYTLTIVGDRNLANAAHLGGLLFGVTAVYWGGPLWVRILRRRHYYKIRRETAAEREEEQQVDRILQKVNEQGMHSLTRGEQKILKRATERQRLAELSRPRRGY